MDLFQLYKSKLSQNKLVFVVFLLFIFSLINHLFSIPRVLVDESLYSYTALNFIQKGTFFHDFFPFSGKEFCLYPLFLSFFYSIFGISFELGRILSVSCGLVTFGFIFAYCKTNKYSDRLTAFIMLSFVCSNLFFIVFKIIRPESLLTVGLTGLLFFLNKYFKEKEKENFHLTFYGIGLCLGITISTHLIGALFGMTLFSFFILFEKNHIKSRNLLALFLASSPFLLILIFNGFDQIFNHNLLEFLSTSDKFVLSIRTFSLNLKYSLFHYIMGYKRFFIFLFELILITFALYKSHPKGFIRLVNTSYLVFYLFCFFSINIYLRPYYVTLVPITIINIGFILSHVKSSKKFISFFFALYLINQLIGNIYIYKTNIDNFSMQEIKNSFIELPSNILLGGDLVCWFFDPRLDWLMNEDINSRDRTSEINQGKDIYWFHLPSPSFVKTSLSKKRSIFLDDGDMPKGVLFKNIYKNQKLISSLKNPNFEDIQLWKLN